MFAVSIPYKLFTSFSSRFVGTLATFLLVLKGWDAALVECLIPIEFSISDISNVLPPADLSE